MTSHFSSIPIDDLESAQASHGHSQGHFLLAEVCSKNIKVQWDFKSRKEV